MHGWRGIVAVGIMVLSSASIHFSAPGPALDRRSPARPGCALLLPQNAFPAGITAWYSVRTAPNTGAVASGLQLAHYRWGYVIVTPDMYPTLRAAQRRYQVATELLRGDRRVRIRVIGQATVAWVTRDGVVGDTVTTILLRAQRTVATVNVGAARPALAVATRLARAIASRACR